MNLHRYNLLTSSNYSPIGMCVSFFFNWFFFSHLLAHTKPVKNGVRMRNRSNFAFCLQSWFEFSLVTESDVSAKIEKYDMRFLYLCIFIRDSDRVWQIINYFYIHSLLQIPYTTNDFDLILIQLHSVYARFVPAISISKHVRTIYRTHVKQNKLRTLQHPNMYQCTCFGMTDESNWKNWNIQFSLVSICTHTHTQRVLFVYQYWFILVKSVVVLMKVENWRTHWANVLAISLFKMKAFALIDL